MPKLTNCVHGLIKIKLLLTILVLLFFTQANAIDTCSDWEAYTVGDLPTLPWVNNHADGSASMRIVDSLSYTGINCMEFTGQFNGYNGAISYIPIGTELPLKISFALKNAPDDVTGNMKIKGSVNLTNDTIPSLPTLGHNLLAFKNNNELWLNLITLDSATMKIPGYNSSDWYYIEIYFKSALNGSDSIDVEYWIDNSYLATIRLENLFDPHEMFFNIGAGERYVWFDDVCITSPSIWCENPDNQTSGIAPEDWCLYGNTSTIVTSDQSFTGSNSIQVNGTLGGCWAGEASHVVDVTFPMHISMAIRNGDENLTGCNQFRGGVYLRNGCSWTNPSVPLINFLENGNLCISVNGYTDTLTGLNLLEWIQIELFVDLVGADSIRVSCWANGEFVGEEVGVYNEAMKSVNSLEIACHEGLAWFDDICVKTKTFDREYLCGDVDNSGQIDISDLVNMVAYMFNDGLKSPIPNAMDVTGDCQIDISDLVSLVAFMFNGGDAPLCGCSRPMTKLAVTEDIILASTFKNGKTTISLSSEDNILGVELYVKGENFGFINTEFSHLDLLYRQDDNIVKIGILDLDGAEYIPQGKNRIIELDGEFEIVSAIVVDDNLNSYAPVINSATKVEVLPIEFALSQNFPNPFNPTTSISFSLPEASDVKLEIFNITGQRVAILAEENFEVGNHSISWDGRESASGVYFYRLEAGNFTKSKKMILMK